MNKNVLCILALLLFATNANCIVNIGWPRIPLLTITTESGEFPTCEVVYPPSGGLGIGITNNDYVCGRLVMTLDGNTVYDTGDYIKDVSGMRIKIRGNSTGAVQGQKPYKIKLSKKFDMLLRGDEEYQEKDWNLLRISTWNPAFLNEESNILTALGFVMSEAIGMPWTPGYTFVNLVMNDKYMGMYYLTDAVERGDKRVNIKNSGYLIENDAYWWNEDLFFKTNHQKSEMGWTFKSPDTEDVDGAVVAKIRTYINDFEDALYAGNDVDEYIDLASFAKWILVHDILNAADIAGTNMYMYKYDYDQSNPTSTKLMMGPLWDFDSSYKNDINDRWSLLHESDYFYYQQLFENEKFVAEYKKQWDMIKPDLLITVRNGLEAIKQTYGDAFEESLNLHKTVYPYECANSLDAQINEVCGKLERRIVGLDHLISQLHTTDISYLDKDKRKIVAIYDIHGMKCTQPLDKLPKGFYIVKYSNALSEKLLKR